MTVAARHADISTQDIICDNGMPAFLAHPTGGGPFPTVILMHERYGLVKHTRDQAMRSARDGFAVLAPNFFFHHPDQPMLNAGDSRYDMTDPESVELIKVALAAMRKTGSPVQIRSAEAAVRTARQAVDGYLSKVKGLLGEAYVPHWATWKLQIQGFLEVAQREAKALGPGWQVQRVVGDLRIGHELLQERFDLLLFERHQLAHLDRCGVMGEADDRVHQAPVPLRM